MAINYVYLQLMGEMIKRLRSNVKDERLKCVALAYPDLIVTREEIMDVFPDLPQSGLVIREDSEQILRYHVIPGKFPHIYDSAALFNALGFDVDYTDVAAHRGIERILDLNEPIPEDMHQAYHLVLDSGTLEHCFNIGQAFKNVAQMPVAGGYIMQTAPINKYNHGFWSVNPTAYYDFFCDNGYKIQYCRALSDENGVPKLFDVPAFDRFVNIPGQSILFCVCKRAEVREIKWPTQFKYKTPAELMANEALYRSMGINIVRKSR